MTVCKATFSGTVFRDPEKRATGTTQIPITFMTLKVDGADGLFVRVVSMGKAADIVEQSFKKNDKAVVDGRLKVTVAKDENGEDRRIMEMDLAQFEKISGNTDSSSTQKQVAKFSDIEEFSDDLIGEEEIPF